MKTTDDPMRSWLDDIDALDQKFRSHVRPIILEHNIKQGRIADVLGVNQSSVSRMFDLTGDLRFPACVTSALNRDETLHPLAKGIIEFQNRPFSNQPIGVIDGCTDDEFRDALQFLGKCVEHEKNGRLNLSMQDIENAQGVLNRLREEIRLKIGRQQ